MAAVVPPAPQQPGQQPAAAGQSSLERPEVSAEDKKLAADWLERIKSALKRADDTFSKFKKNRELVIGKGQRAPLHYANLASMLPQIYAKDPEFSAQPSKAVGPEQVAAAKAFAATAESMLQRVVVKDGKLKTQAKKAIRSTFPTSVGWIKASWQEDKRTDVLIANRIKDTQDNIAAIETQLKVLDDAKARTDAELEKAKLDQLLKGLETQTEVVVAKGIALDFVMSEDILVIDPSIRAVTDYTRSSAMAHRVWMTPDKYRATFGYDCKKGKSYSEQSGAMKGDNGSDKAASLLCVWEIWDQDSNRLFYVCDGEEGFCKEPSSVDWTGRRWYPFFLIAFNEADGTFYPMSDVELTDKLVQEYNEAREDFVRDRRGALPLNVVKKGGGLTPADVERISNRTGSDVIAVDGTPNKPLSEDIFSGQLSKLDPASYDTAGSRYDMERVLGGGDTATGSITKAKTLGEAEILQQGLRSRSAERQDILEDMLNELGPYCIEVMLRKFSLQEVQAIAGPQASWPQMAVEDIFNLVTLEVRGGSTGKPDRLQEQDRWTKLLPIIKEAVQTISELREKGQDALAQAVIELTRETLRRFDERLDIEEFLPKVPQGEDDPQVLKQQNITLTRQVEELMARLKDAVEKVEKGYVSAAAQIATSANPMLAAQAFNVVMVGIDPDAPQMQQPAGMPQEQEMGQEGAEPVGQPEDGQPEPMGAPVPPQQTAIEPQPQ